MTKDELEQLDLALATEGGLSAREIDFLDNLDNNWRNRNLTHPQEKWLKDIADRIA